MALTDADLERARQAAASAPPLSPELLASGCAPSSAGCVSAQMPPAAAAEPQPAQGGDADAA